MKKMLWLCVILMIIATTMCLYLTVSLGSFLLGPTITAVVAYATWGLIDCAVSYEES